MCDAVSSPPRWVTTVAKLNSSMKSWSRAKSSTANTLGTYIPAHCNIFVGKLNSQHVRFTARLTGHPSPRRANIGSRGGSHAIGGRFYSGYLFPQRNRNGGPDPPKETQRARNAG